MLLNGEGTLRALDKDDQRREIRTRLLAIGPTPVYAGLLAYAQRRGWKPGWAAFAFKEIFGVWPRREDRVEPAILEGFVIEEWAAYRPKHRRIKLEKPAPLLAPIEKSELKINPAGFVEGTLMTVEDFNVEWK